MERDDDSGKGDEYLTVAELAERIKFSRQTIYNMVSARRLVMGRHYFKPTRKKILFVWSAVKAWIERDEINGVNETGDHAEVSKIKI